MKSDDKQRRKYKPDSHGPDTNDQRQELVR